MKNAFYMSFVDSTFLGALVIEANNPIEAMVTSHMLGLNPGGEIMSIDLGYVTDEWFGGFGNRLLSKHEAQNLPDWRL
jgi:hypothetical protein